MNTFAGTLPEAFASNHIDASSDAETQLAFTVHFDSYDHIDAACSLYLIINALLCEQHMVQFDKRFAYTVADNMMLEATENVIRTKLTGAFSSFQYSNDWVSSADLSPELSQKIQSICGAYIRKVSSFRGEDSVNEETANVQISVSEAARGPKSPKTALSVQKSQVKGDAGGADQFYLSANSTQMVAQADAIIQSVLR